MSAYPSWSINVPLGPAYVVKISRLPFKKHEQILTHCEPGATRQPPKSLPFTTPRWSQITVRSAARHTFDEGTSRSVEKKRAVAFHLRWCKKPKMCSEKPQLHGMKLWNLSVSQKSETWQYTCRLCSRRYAEWYSYIHMHVHHSPCGAKMFQTNWNTTKITPVLIQETPKLQDHHQGFQ